ncbi:unnamed protein product [Peniophora sp. CBMAI 1063]|nr:unnamed protein product [Peniophora sp. CBMAI 1063]
MMPPSNHPATFRLSELPVEMILEIALWAQILWHRETFAAQAPYAGVRRSAAGGPLNTSASLCCEGMDESCRRPICLKVSVPREVRSPAQCLSEAGSHLRELMLKESSNLWLYDNTLLPQIAARSGVRRMTENGHLSIQYGATNLLATHVCACLIPGIASFFDSLTHIKIALPGGIGLSTLEEYFERRGRHKASLLRHIDVEIYSEHSVRSAIRGHRHITAIKSPNVVTSRFSNMRIFCYSPVMTSLCLYQNGARRITFTRSLSHALKACSLSLQYLTIDVGGASFEDLATVTLHSLRHLRVVAPESTAGELLRNLRLPPALDLHLEPVVEWGRACRAWTQREPPYEVPFEAIELAASETDACEFSQYALTLAMPDQTNKIFTWLPTADTAGSAIWASLVTMGLDVRLDRFTGPQDRASARLPEYVGLALADSMRELLPVLADPESRDWRRCLPFEHKGSARRSLAVRTGDYNRSESRSGAFDSSFPKALYDALRYVVHTVLEIRKDSPIAQLIFGKDSWLPDRSLAYAHILDKLDAVRSICFASPLLPDGIPFTQNVEGVLAMAHLEALALYLNTPVEGDVYPCPCLENIAFELHHALPSGRLSPASDLTQLFNSRERLRSGVCVAIAITDLSAL